MRTIKSGFTLIELLVVIAIIAIITSVGVANLLTAQKQARDSARREIIGNIQSAFEQYFAETGAYPTSVGGDIPSAFENGVTPTDPKNSGVYLIDYSLTDTDAYCVCATLETGVGNAGVPASITCNWTGTTHYCAQNKQ